MAFLTEPIGLLIGGLLFLAVFFLVEGGFIWWNSRYSPEAKRIASRIRGLSAGGQHSEQISLLKERLLANSSPSQRFLLSLPRLTAVDRQLVLSGLGWSVSKFIWMTVGTGGGLFLALLLFRMPFVSALVFGLIGLLLPYQYVRWRVTKRLKRFEELLPDALDLIGRAMRAGHALPTTLQMVGQEMPDPIGPEFQQTFDEINFGVDTSVAMQNMARRVPSLDLNFFVIAVLIQRESGGNLGEILGNISRIIRERLTLLGKVRALSAEGRMSAWILCLLPFFTAAMLNALNPEMMKVLWTDPMGRMMSLVALISMGMGVLWIRAVVRIKV